MQGKGTRLRLTAAAAVVGSPISHSLSPALHRAAYADLGLTDWTYDAIEVEAGTLVDRCRRLAQDGIGGRPVVGLSVTMPLKREAHALAVAVDPTAGPLGAANTLIRIDPEDPASGWTAYNTDVDGIIGAAHELGLTDLDGRRCILLGAGGTAAAVVTAFWKLGARQVDIVARDATRATSIVHLAEALGLSASIHPWSEGAHLIAAANLVVSTVPQGAADEFCTASWRQASVLIDAVYNCGPTPLVLAAIDSGARAAGGVLMLLHQAVRQVELMTGQAPDLEVMRAALSSR